MGGHPGMDLFSNCNHFDFIMCVAKIHELQGLLVQVEDENEELKQQKGHLECKLRTLEDSLGTELSSNNDLKKNIEDILREKQKELQKAQG